MKDNYDNKVPRLVLMPSVDIYHVFNDEQIKQLVGADWYMVVLGKSIDAEETITALMAPEKQIGKIAGDETFLSSNGILGNLSWDTEDWMVAIEILAVDDVLKRWSNEDGFYTA